MGALLGERIASFGGFEADIEDQLASLSGVADLAGAIFQLVGAFLIIIAQLTPDSLAEAAFPALLTAVLDHLVRSGHYGPLSSNVTWPLRLSCLVSMPTFLSIREAKVPGLAMYGPPL